MEKDIGKIAKNPDTDIIIRVDDFGGRPGLTIREFVNKSESGFTGFTKAGVRIRADAFEEFKGMINSIDPKDLEEAKPEETPKESEPKEESKEESKEENDSGIDDSGLI
ncbi:MAG: hypothetical protein IH845_02945 [Nanoarchaeota archaeon]|nr:hypothetical protein [Nanoarchaeota archaeon]